MSDNSRSYLIHPSSAVLRLLSALRENGHTVVDWKPYKHDFAVDLIGGIYAGDGGTARYPQSFVVEWD